MSAKSLDIPSRLVVSMVVVGQEDPVLSAWIVSAPSSQLEVSATSSEVVDDGVGDLSFSLLAAWSRFHGILFRLLHRLSLSVFLRLASELNTGRFRLLLQFWLLFLILCESVAPPLALRKTYLYLNLHHPYNRRLRQFALSPPEYPAPFVGAPSSLVC